MLTSSTLKYKSLGEKLIKKVDALKDVRKDLLCKASKVAETAIKFGTECAHSSDPFAAAASVSSKTGAGASVSRFSASQCAGLVGVIVASFTPQVTARIKSF